MNDSCPVMTPEQRLYLDIQQKAEQAMLATIFEAVDRATAMAAEELRVAGSQDFPPPFGYFATVAQQKLFVKLCGGDPETFAGGNAELAGHVIRNLQNVTDHYFTQQPGKPQGSSSTSQ